MRTDISNSWNEMEFSESEREHFKQLVQNDIRETKIEDLKSGDYVIEIFESSIVNQPLSHSLQVVGNRNSHSLKLVEAFFSISSENKQ